MQDDIADHSLGMHWIMRRYLRARGFGLEPRVTHLKSTKSDLDYAFELFLAAQRAFISADNFFLAAALIGGRLLAFLGADLPFHFAQRCFMAAEIRLRAAGLM